MGLSSINIDLGVEQTVFRDFRSTTLDKLLEKNARVNGEKVAVSGEQGDVYTYAELDERVTRLARGLASCGLEYGDTIAVLSENRPEFVELYYAGSRLGAPIAAQNWRLEKPELLHCLDVVNADAVFISDAQKEKVEWIKNADNVSPEIVIGIDEEVGEMDYDELLHDGETVDVTIDSSPSPEDIVAILYTSGTTGLPKGAAISNRALIARGQTRFVMGTHTREKPDHVAWLPMFHMASADFISTVALQSGTYYPVDGFKPEIIIDRVAESDTKHLIMVPATLQPILDYVYDEGIDINDSSIDIDYIGSQPDLVAPNKIAELSEIFDAKYFNSFGSTETGFPPATGNHFDVGEAPSPEMWKTESPLCDVQLVDSNWEPVKQGGVGEIAVRGPTLFSGYMDNPEANKQDFKDGWFRMGDMFRRDTDGRLAFVDRRKYLIKSGGENIYPAEIEKPLMEHDSVNEAIAVRISDEKWGEVPKVYVAPESDSTIEPNEVLEILDGTIARYKLPHYVEIVDQTDFPRSTSGKIQRTKVEEWPVTEDNRIRNP